MGGDRTKSANLFDIHQGTHILQSLDGFAFAISRDGRFLYISETVSMYLGLSQVEMTGSSVFDYTHQQDHEELARQLGIPYASLAPGNEAEMGASRPFTSTSTTTTTALAQESSQHLNSDSPAPPNSVRSQYSTASQDTLIEDHINNNGNHSSQAKKKFKGAASARGAYRGSSVKRQMTTTSTQSIKQEPKVRLTGGCDSIDHDKERGELESDANLSKLTRMHDDQFGHKGTEEDPLVRQFCIRMKSTLTKRGCQHFKSSGYRVVHVVAHLRTYQSNDHGHLMDPLDDPLASRGIQQQSTGASGAGAPQSSAGGGAKQAKRRGPKGAQVKQETIAVAATCKTKSSDSNNNLTPGSGGGRDGTNNVGTVSGKAKIIGMVAVAIALPPPSINELRLESDTFVFRLGLDLRVTHIEPKVTELLDYQIEMIAGKSLYSLVHPADVHQVQMCHRDLLRKGQMMSGYYRLLARTGGYIWVQTCATLICNNNPLAVPVSQSTAMLQATDPIAQSSCSSTSAVSMQPMTSYSQMNHQSYNNHNQMPMDSQYAQHATQQPQQLPQQSKISSPSVSSHLSSNFDGQDQDQCVIFVNYMITDVIERDTILDICQDPVAQHSLSSLTTTSSSNYTQISGSIPNSLPSYSSPAPSSSPCLTTLKSSNSSTASLSNGNYMEPPATSSPHRQATFQSQSHNRIHHHNNHHHQQQQKSTGENQSKSSYSNNHHHKSGNRMGRPNGGSLSSSSAVAAKSSHLKHLQPIYSQQQQQQPQPQQQPQLGHLQHHNHLQGYESSIYGAYGSTLALMSSTGSVGSTALGAAAAATATIAATNAAVDNTTASTQQFYPMATGGSASELSLSGSRSSGSRFSASNNNQHQSYGYKSTFGFSTPPSSSSLSSELTAATGSYAHSAGNNHPLHQTAEQQQQQHQQQHTTNQQHHHHNHHYLEAYPVSATNPATNHHHQQAAAAAYYNYYGYYSR